MDPEKDQGEEEVDDTSLEKNDTTDNEESDKKAQPEDTKEPVPAYRPKPEGKKDETVPLSKYMEEKNARKALEAALRDKSKASGETEINSEDLDDLAKEFDLDPGFVKKFAKTVEARAEKRAEAKIAPIIQKERETESVNNFNRDFDKSILAVYGQEAEKFREHFQRLAFDPNLVHYDTLEALREAYFPTLKAAAKPTKDTNVEGGSQAAPGKSDAETIDFAKMDEDTHIKVLKDSKLRAQYYAWQDANG